MVKILQPVDYMNSMRACMKLPKPEKALQLTEDCQIKTLEGIIEGKSGDYLIEGVAGEYYICDREIFEHTYRWVSDDEIREKRDYYNR